MKNVVSKRQDFIKKRKNFFPTLLVTIVLWAIVGLWIYFIDPDVFAAIPLMLFLVFLALLFTLSTLLGNTRRGFILALGTVSFLILRLLGIGNILNALLLLGLLTTVEFYFIKRK
jgi:hypothetical protein